MYQRVLISITLTFFLLTSKISLASSNEQKASNPLVLLEFFFNAGRQLGIQGIECDNDDRSGCLDDPVNQIVAQTSHVAAVLEPVIKPCIGLTGNAGSFENCVVEKATDFVMQPETYRQQLAILYHIVRRQPFELQSKLLSADVSPDVAQSRVEKWVEIESKNAFEALVLLGNTWRRYHDATDEVEKNAKRIAEKVDEILNSGQGQALSQQLYKLPESIASSIRVLIKDRGMTNFMRRMKNLAEFGAQFDLAVAETMRQILLANNSEIGRIESVVNELTTEEWQKLAPAVQVVDRNILSLKREMVALWSEMLCESGESLNDCLDRQNEDAAAIFQLLLNELRGNLNNRIQTLFMVADTLTESCVNMPLPDSAGSASSFIQRTERINLINPSGKNEIESSARKTAQWFQRCKPVFEESLAALKDNHNDKKVVEDIEKAARQEALELGQDVDLAIARAKQEDERLTAAVNDSLSLYNVASKALINLPDPEEIRQDTESRTINALRTELEKICSSADVECVAVRELVEAGSEVEQVKAAVKTAYETSLADCLLRVPTLLQSAPSPDEFSIYVRPSEVLRQGRSVRMAIELQLAKGNFELPTPGEFCAGVTQEPTSNEMPFFFDTKLVHELEFELPEALIKFEVGADFYQQKLAAATLRMEDVSEHFYKNVQSRLQIPTSMPLLDDGVFSYSIQEGVTLRWASADVCLQIVAGSDSTAAECVSVRDENGLKVVATQLLNQKIAGRKAGLKEELNELMQQTSRTIEQSIGLTPFLENARFNSHGDLIYQGKLREFLPDDHPMVPLLGQSGVFMCLPERASDDPIVDLIIDPRNLVGAFNNGSPLRIYPLGNASSGVEVTNCHTKYIKPAQEYDLYLVLEDSPPQKLATYDFADCGMIPVPSSQRPRLIVFNGLNITINNVSTGDGGRCFDIPDSVYIDGRLDFNNDLSSDSVLSVLKRKRIDIALIVSKDEVRFDANEFSKVRRWIEPEMRRLGVLPQGLCLEDLEIVSGTLRPVIGRVEGSRCLNIDGDSTLLAFGRSLEDLGEAAAVRILADSEFQELWNQLSDLPDTSRLALTIKNDLSFVPGGLNREFSDASIGDYFEAKCTPSEDESNFIQCTIKTGKALSAVMHKDCEREFLRIDRAEDEVTRYLGRTCLKNTMQKIVPADVRDQFDIQNLNNDQFKAIPTDEGMQITVNVALKEGEFKQIAGIDRYTVKFDVNWDGRVAANIDVARQLRDWSNAYLASIRSESLNGLQEHIDSLVDQIDKFLDGTPINVASDRSKWKYLREGESPLPFPRAEELTALPIGIETDARVNLGDTAVTLKNLGLTETGLKFSSVTVVNSELEAALKRHLDLGDTFDDIRVEHIASLEDKIAFRIHFGGFGDALDDSGVAVSLGALNPTVDIAIGAGGLAINGNIADPKTVLLGALVAGINNSGTLPFSLVSDDGVELDFDEVAAKNGNLSFIGTLQINGELNIAMDIHLDIPVFSDGHPRLVVKDDGLKSLIKNIVLANISLPELGGYKIDRWELDPTPGNGLPKKIKVLSSMTLWEVVNVSLPTYSISKDGIKVEGQDVLKITTGDAVAVPIPPFFSMTEIGGSISKKEIQALATLAPIEPSLKRLVRMDGRHIFKFDEPLRLESQSQLKLLNFMTLGSAYREIDLGNGLIKQGFDLGGVASDVIDIKGSATTALKQATFIADGELSLFGAKAGADGYFETGLLSGRSKARGIINIEDFIEGNMEFESGRLFQLPRGQAKVDIDVGQFNLSHGRLRVDKRLAHLRFKVLFLSLGIGFPNLSEMNPEAILELIKDMLSPDFSNLDEALLSLLKGNFAFNPASSFGGGDGSGLDDGGGDGSGLDGSDGDDSGSDDVGVESSDQSGGYSELAQHAAATESSNNANHTVGETTPDTEPNQNAEGQLKARLNSKGDVNVGIETSSNSSLLGDLKLWYSGEAKGKYLTVPLEVDGNAVFRKETNNWVSVGEIVSLDVPEFTAGERKQEEGGLTNSLLTVIPHAKTTACDRQSVFYWFAGSSKFEQPAVGRVPASIFSRPDEPKQACWDSRDALIGNSGMIAEDPILGAFFAVTADEVSQYQDLPADMRPINTVADAFWLPMQSASPTNQLPDDREIALAVRYEGDSHHVLFVFDRGDYVSRPTEVTKVPKRKFGVFAVAFADKMKTWTTEKQQETLARLLENTPASTEIYTLDDEPLLVDDTGISTWNNGKFETLVEGCETACGHITGHEERQIAFMGGGSEEADEVELNLEVITDPTGTGTLPPGMGGAIGGSGYSDRLVRTETGFELRRYSDTDTYATLIELPPSVVSDLKRNDAQDTYEPKGLYFYGSRGVYSHLIGDEPWSGKFAVYFGSLGEVVTFSLPGAGAIPRQYLYQWLEQIIAQVSHYSRDGYSVSSTSFSTPNTGLEAVSFKSSGQLITFLHGVSRQDGPGIYQLLPFDLENEDFSPDFYLTDVGNALVNLDQWPEPGLLRLLSSNGNLYGFSENALFYLTSGAGRYLGNFYSINDGGPMRYVNNPGSARRTNELIRNHAIKFGLKNFSATNEKYDFIVSGPHGGASTTSFSYKTLEDTHYTTFIGHTAEDGMQVVTSAETARLSILIEELINWSENTVNPSLKQYFDKWVISSTSGGENVPYTWVQLCRGRSDFSYPQTSSYSTFEQWIEAEFRALAAEGVEDLDQWVRGVANDKCPSVDPSNAISLLDEALGDEFDDAKTNRLITMNPTALSIKDLQSLIYQPRKFAQAVQQVEQWQSPAHVVHGNDTFVLTDNRICNEGRCAVYDYRNNGFAKITEVDLPDEIEPLFLIDLGAYFTGKSLSGVQQYDVMPEPVDLSDEESKLYAVRFPGSSVSHIYSLIDDQARVLMVSNPDAFYGMSIELKRNLLQYLATNEIQRTHIHQVGDYYFAEAQDLLIPFNEEMAPDKAISGFTVPEVLKADVLGLISERLTEWLSDDQPSFRDRLISANDVTGVALNPVGDEWDVVLRVDERTRISHAINICRFSQHLFQPLAQIDSQIDNSMGYYIQPNGDADCAYNAPAVLTQTSANRMFFLDDNAKDRESAIPEALEEESLLIAYAKEMMRWRSQHGPSPEPTEITAILHPEPGLAISFDNVTVQPRRYTYLISGDPVRSISLSIYSYASSPALNEVMATVACLVTTTTPPCSNAPSSSGVPQIYIMPDGEIYANQNGRLSQYQPDQQLWSVIAEGIPDLGELTPSVVQALAFQQPDKTVIEILDQIPVSPSMRAARFSVGYDENSDGEPQNHDSWIAALDLTSNNGAGLLWLRSLDIDDISLDEDQLLQLAGRALEGYAHPEIRRIFRQNNRLYEIIPSEEQHALFLFGQSSSLGSLDSLELPFVRAVADRAEAYAYAPFSSQLFGSADDSVLAVQFAGRNSIDLFFETDSGVVSTSFDAYELLAGVDKQISLDDDRVSRQLREIVDSGILSVSSRLRLYLTESGKSYRLVGKELSEGLQDRQFGLAFPTNETEEIYRHFIRRVDMDPSLGVFASSYNLKASSGLGFIGRTESGYPSPNLQEYQLFGSVKATKDAWPFTAQMIAQRRVVLRDDAEPIYLKKALRCSDWLAPNGEQTYYRTHAGIASSIDSDIFVVQDDCVMEPVGTLSSNVNTPKVPLLKVIERQLNRISNPTLSEPRIQPPFTEELSGQLGNGQEFMLVKFDGPQTSPECTSHYELQLGNETNFASLSSACDEIVFSNLLIESIVACGCVDWDAEEPVIKLYESQGKFYALSGEALWLLGSGRSLPIVEVAPTSLMHLKALLALLSKVEINDSTEPLTYQIFNASEETTMEGVALADPAAIDQWWIRPASNAPALGSERFVRGLLWEDQYMIRAMTYWISVGSNRSEIVLLPETSENSRYLAIRPEPGDKFELHGAELSPNRPGMLAHLGKIEPTQYPELTRHFVQLVEQHFEKVTTSYEALYVQWFLPNDSMTIAFTVGAGDRLPNQDIRTVLPDANISFAYRSDLPISPDAQQFLRGAALESPDLFSESAEFATAGGNYYVESNRQDNFALISSHSCTNENTGHLIHRNYQSRLLGTDFTVETLDLFNKYLCPELRHVSPLKDGNNTMALLIDEEANLALLYRRGIDVLLNQQLTASFRNASESVAIAAISLIEREPAAEFDPGADHKMARANGTLFFYSANDSFDAEWRPYVYPGAEDPEHRLKAVWDSSGKTVLTQIDGLSSEDFEIISASAYHSVVQTTAETRNIVFRSEISGVPKIATITWALSDQYVKGFQKEIEQGGLEVYGGVNNQHPCHAAQFSLRGAPGRDGCFRAAIADLESAVLKDGETRQLSVNNVFVLLDISSRQDDPSWHNDPNTGNRRYSRPMLDWVYGLFQY